MAWDAADRKLFEWSACPWPLGGPEVFDGGCHVASVPEDDGVDDQHESTGRAPHLRPGPNRHRAWVQKRTIAYNDQGQRVGPAHPALWADAGFFA